MNAFVIAEASLIGVLRILLIIVLIYYGFRLLARYVFPYLLRNYVKKQQEKFYEQHRQYGKNQGEFHYDDDDNEGEVKIKYNPGSSSSKKKKQKSTDDEGEYVDFEEIE